MPLLLHLNGASGVGKSTLARRWADDHPGSLNLEADHIAAMLGGWRQDFAASFGSSRSLAIALARDHLAAGHDVVMPQLITRTDEAARFEAVAKETGASYREVALLVSPEEQLRRFELKSPGSEVDRAIHRYLGERGGASVLLRIHGHLTAYVDLRPDVVRLDTEGLDPEVTYRALIAVAAAPDKQGQADVSGQL